MDSLVHSVVGKKQQCQPFCDCEFLNYMAIKFIQNIDDTIKCRCGEEDYHKPLAWQWHLEPGNSTEMKLERSNIIFHPIYSQGTAIIRGDRALKPGMIHFWEMRIITALVGTDVMFGIGTDQVDINQFKYHFVSGLGTNKESWGFSYHGKIQHNGVIRQYGQKFSLGCIIGICLDLTLGQLEFFLNRRSLGVAYKNIPTDRKLYPMICSTAAKSIVRLLNCSSKPDSLQLRAFQRVAKNPDDLCVLRSMPGLYTIMKSYWFLAPPVRYSARSRENEIDIGDEAVLSKDRLKRKTKHKTGDEEDDSDDIYANVHKIAAQGAASGDSEEDSTADHNEYFDEYFHFAL